MQFVVVLLLGFLIFLFMKGVRLGLRRLASLYPGWNFSFNFLTTIEFIIWIVYIFWATNHLFREKFFFSYLIYSIFIITFGLLTWFLFADVIAGVVFKAKYNLRPGMNIKTVGFSGIIKSQNITHIKLRTDEGQVVRIPYSRINHLVISEMIHAESMAEHTIHIQVQPDLSKSKAEILIRDIIINSPWSNLKEEPTIKFTKETDKGYIVDVLLFSTSLKHMKFIEIALDENPSLKVIT